MSCLFPRKLDTSIRIRYYTSIRVCFQDYILGATCKASGDLVLRHKTQTVYCRTSYRDEKSRGSPLGDSDGVTLFRSHFSIFLSALGRVSQILPPL